MDSQDQGESQSTIEQPKVEANSEQPKGSEEASLIELPDGTKVTPEEAALGYMRTADYTRKTQELSKTKKELEGEKTNFVRNAVPSKEEIDPEIAQAAEVLKKAGFITKDDLLVQEQKMVDERKLQSLIDANPDLASKEDAIRAIGKTDSRAWEDIIGEYGFKETNKILRAKTRSITGQPTPKEAPKDKPFKDLSSEEYANWKVKNLGKSTF